jgi:hypothetical protein
MTYSTSSCLVTKLWIHGIYIYIYVWMHVCMYVTVWRCPSPRRPHVSSRTNHGKQTGSATYHSVKPPYLSVIRGWYSIHGLCLTSPLKTKVKLQTGYLLGVRFAGLHRRPTPDRSEQKQQAQQRNCHHAQLSTAECHSLQPVFRWRHEEAALDIPVRWVSRLEWRHYTHIRIHRPHATQVAACESCAPRLASGTSHSFGIWCCTANTVIFKCDFSFGGRVHTQLVTQLWHGVSSQHLLSVRVFDCQPLIMGKKIKKCNFFTLACVKSDRIGIDPKALFRHWFHTGCSTSLHCGPVIGHNLPERTLVRPSCSCNQLRCFSSCVCNVHIRVYVMYIYVCM